MNESGDKFSLQEFRAVHKLEEPASSHWSFHFGSFTFSLPNFSWRQAAIDAHDQHHMMTGYPLTMRGEIQMAAWEWGAGRYPDWRATAFCGPLILAGILIMPIRTYRAYRNGKKSESLYPKS